MTIEHGTDGTVSRRTMEVVSFIVMCGAVTGFFIGIKSPMNPEQRAMAPVPVTNRTQRVASGSLAAAIPATAYKDMSARDAGPNRDWTTKLTMLKPEPYDAFAEIKLDPQQKLASLS